MVVKIIFMLLFFAVMVAVGIYSRKHATNVNGFVLGGRKVGPWMTAFAYGTSYFSAVVFIGYAGQFGWKYGMSSTWIGIGNAVIGSLLAWMVLGRRTRIMTKAVDSATMPDFFGKRYGSNALKIVASVIVFVFLIPYTASVYNGLSNLFEMAFNIDYRVCVIIMATLTGLYVILGGYMATAINDFIQGIFMLFGIAAVIIGVLHNQGGLSAAVSALSQIESDIPATAGQVGKFTALFGTDPRNLLGVVILTSLGTWGLPQMVGKFYAIDSDKSVKIGTIVSTVFAVIVAGGSYFLGGFGRLFDSPAIYKADGSVAFDKIVPQMLSTLPEILIGVVIVLVLSASMSTLSSLVLTSSSTLTLDLIQPAMKEKIDSKKQLLIMRIFIVFFILISVVIALDPPTFIAQLMGISWGALAGAFLAPFLYGLYWKGVTKLSVWVTFLFGVGVTVANMYLKFFASPINCGAFTMLASLVLVPVVSLLTPKQWKPDEKEMNKLFSCYDK